MKRKDPLKETSSRNSSTDVSPPTKKIPFKMLRKLKLIVMNSVVMENLDHGGVNFTSSGTASGILKYIVYDIHDSEIVTKGEKNKRRCKLK